MDGKRPSFFISLLPCWSGPDWSGLKQVKINKKLCKKLLTCMVVSVNIKLFKGGTVMKLTKSEQAALNELKDFFGLENADVYVSKDKDGTYINVDELGFIGMRKDFETSVKELIEGYKFATSKEALDLLKIREKRDNEKAKWLGLKQYEVVEVTMLKNFLRYGVVIRFKDSGIERNFIETSLSYALRNKKELERYVNRERCYFTAGGLENEDVDFIFCDVGHSSKKQLYTFEDNEIF